MKTINRQEMQNIVENAPETPVVEVLNEEQFEKFHIPGAINVPLSNDFDKSIQDAVPVKTKPVVVYCMDEDCDASPKAAKRMESLGFLKVFDYADGKMDWKGAGLPVEQG